MYVFDVSTSDPAETVQLEAIYHAQEEGGPRILASLRRDGECVALSTHTHTLDDEIVINESGGRKVFVRLVPAGDSIVG